MKIVTRLVASLATLILLPVLLACGGGSGSGGNALPTPTLYTIMVNVGTGAKANPTTSRVEEGKSLSITVTAESGYQVDSVTGCGGTLNNSIYTTAPIHADGTVTVKAKPLIYNVTASVGTGVHASPATATVEHGKTATFTLSLDAGYQLATATGCNGLLNGMTYTTGAMTSDGAVQFTAKPLVYNVTASVGTGVHASPATATVEHGKTATFTLSLDAGYQLATATGCDGLLNGMTYTTGAMTSDGAVQFTAKPLVYNVTASVGTGVHASPTTATVEHGKTVTFALSLDAGYQLATATGCNGLLNGMTYTTGAMTADGTVEFTAVADIPRATGKIAFVVAPDVLADMPSLLRSFMDAVALETGSATVLIPSPADAATLRTALKNQGSGLRLAFLIGDIPALMMRIVSPDGTFKSKSDHYYRALEYPYGTPYQDASGDVVVDVTPFSNLLSSSCPTIATARIKGLTPESQLGDIRRYLDRNLLLRGNRSHYLRGFTFISAATGSGVDGTKFLEAYQDHPLYGNGEVTFLGNLSAVALKQGFLDALASGREHCEANLHGSPQSVLFQGLSGDGLSIDALEFASMAIRAKVVSLASCSTGDFTASGYLAGQILFSPTSSVLLVRANPAVTLYNDSAFAQEARMLDMALGAGRSYMDSYATTFSGEPPHFLGDPTVRLRIVDLSQPRPRLVFQEKRYHQEFREPLNFQTTSVQGAAVQQDLTFRNLGDADLVIDGSCFSYGIDVDGTFPWGGNSGPAGFSTPYIFNDSSIKTKMDGSYTFKLAPGASKTIRVEFTPARLSDGSIPVGSNHSVMFFSCNDPEIGSFRVDLLARTQ